MKGFDSRLGERVCSVPARLGRDESAWILWENSPVWNREDPESWFGLQDTERERSAAEEPFQQSPAATEASKGNRLDPFPTCSLQNWAVCSRIHCEKILCCQ